MKKCFVVMLAAVLLGIYSEAEGNYVFKTEVRLSCSALRFNQGERLKCRLKKMLADELKKSSVEKIDFELFYWNDLDYDDAYTLMVVVVRENLTKAYVTLGIPTEATETGLERLAQSWADSIRSDFTQEETDP